MTEIIDLSAHDKTYKTYHKRYESNMRDLIDLSAYNLKVYRFAPYDTIR